ncbi:MAG: hypothetical protein JSW34_00620 [Candidatus Zixiibacteriota bacterium]|nr:MAG: hypothetical protein JSW34_00620 [candidate division Zixibacteria bacterium]
MRLRTFTMLVGAILILTSAATAGSSSEDEFVADYLKRLEKKHTTRLTWLSAHFTFNRINRDNDYNKFANYESLYMTDGAFPWLGDGKSFGLDFGIVFAKRFAWMLGGEYWLKMGTTLDGTYYYTPSGTYVENPSSEVRLMGASTGIQYYLFNAPKKEGRSNKLSVRVGAGVGFYQVKWDLWEEYQDLNLSTDVSDAGTATFMDTSPGFTVNLGIDYPTKIWDIVLGIDMSVMYLNFDNVAWYNTQEQEIVATWTGDADGRVDLEFTGIRGKVELKHFFVW